MAFPDFLIIGAQKAGTTWLHRNLQVHPQVWMPKEKELHYFDEKLINKSSLTDRIWGKRPMDERWRRQVKRQASRYGKQLSLRHLAWDFNYFLRPYGDRWYASLFKQGKGSITGEATPDYSIITRDAIAHAHELMPDAKIVFMMRNPIERPWSQALMNLRHGGDAEAMSQEELSLRFSATRSWLHTDYLRTLENWGSYYPPERIFVGFLEDVHFYPTRLLERLYHFLGVKTDIQYRVIKRKIHSRDVETMPMRVASHLARLYLEDTRRLEERFGGYASYWRYCAEWLLENVSEERILYPLWESPLWERWAVSVGKGPVPGSQEAEPQSGPLTSLQAQHRGE